MYILTHRCTHIHTKNNTIFLKIKVTVSGPGDLFLSSQQSEVETRPGVLGKFNSVLGLRPTWITSACATLNQREGERKGFINPEGLHREAENQCLSLSKFTEQKPALWFPHWKLSTQTGTSLKQDSEPRVVVHTCHPSTRGDREEAIQGYIMRLSQKTKYISREH